MINHFDFGGNAVQNPNPVSGNLTWAFQDVICGQLAQDQGTQITSTMTG